MTSLADATAAPKLLEHKGRTYRLRPLDYDSIGEIERWLQSEHIAVTERNIAEREGRKNGCMPPSLKDRLLSEAYARSSRIHMNSPDADALLCTAEGASLMIHGCMKRDHPDITIEHVREMLSDPETKMPDEGEVAKFMAIFQSLHSGQGQRPDAKKKRRRRRKRERVNKGN